MASYALKGPQVQPDASYWGFCPKLCIVPLEKLLQRTDDPNSTDFFPPWEESQVDRELQELLDLARRRDDPCALVNTKPCKEAPSICGPEPKKLPKAYDCRRPISRLLNLPPPIGAPLVQRMPGEQIIRTGRGMARAVESETPGLYHRNALNYLIGMRHWSPPRQALVWAALDVAIASALQAAWYYKWLSPRSNTSFRQRPIEYGPAKDKLRVLFDCPDELNPAYNLCPDGRPAQGKECGPNLSGTPRHPAYPSGHSTYSGAASEILSYFFGNQKTPRALPWDERLGSMENTTLKDELDNMADNIGMGRLWAGIHWRSDHEAGMKLGRVVGRMVIEQLLEMGSVVDGKIAPFVLCPPEPRVPKNQCNFSEEQEPCDMSKKPPKIGDLQKEKKIIVENCDKPKGGKCDPCDAPDADYDPKALIDMNRSANRGGA
ncbi:MAG TPA: vanadium-dependent haloperoxidase [Thermoanaerobaculia bacterium]|nr:vanadium-dependent haloperoxidase [Thermoanaerobaculia bacterium]